MRKRHSQDLPHPLKTPRPACSRPACELTRARAGRRRRTLAVHRWDSVLRNMVTTSGRVLGLSARSGGQVLKQDSRPECQHSDIAPPPCTQPTAGGLELGTGTGPYDAWVTVGRGSTQCCIWLCGLLPPVSERLAIRTMAQVAVLGALLGCGYRVNG